MNPCKQCECGAWSGVHCSADDATTLVEWMPASLRESHRVAGNSGAYPSNGAIRSTVSASCAAHMIDTDGDWCSEVGEETINQEDCS